MGFIKNREIADKLVLGINAAILMIGGYQFLDEGEYIFAVILFLSGGFVLVAIRYNSIFKDRIETTLFFFNVIVASFTSWDFFRLHKHYIQYAWLFIAIVYLILGLRNVFRKKSIPSVQDPTVNHHESSPGN